MIKLEHVVLPSAEQMEFVIEGMRNPLNSWHLSDSMFERGMTHVGENDYKLMKNLVTSGTDHRKFLRMMPVMVRITAPLYWWKEFDTYKVGTVANSCSTMHKITSKEFTIEDFSTDQLGVITGEDLELLDYDAKDYRHKVRMDMLLELEFYRKLYLAADKKLKRSDLTDAERRHTLNQRNKFWWQIIQLLPSSYNQTRNVILNYEVLLNMYEARKYHKLDEWREFCKWIETLPYADLFVEKGEVNEKIH